MDKMAKASEDWQSEKDLPSANLYMLENQVMTDVTFVFPAKSKKPAQKVEAHKYILVCRSSVFYAMFCGSFQETGKDISIPDIESDIFQEFLKFLYTDDITIKPENALHLLYAAKKYQVAALENKCKKYLECSIDGDSVTFILDQTVFYAEKHLQEKCTDYLKKNLNTSFQSLQKHHVRQETLEILVSDKEKICMEKDLFMYCEAWTRKECRKQNKVINIENQRAVLGPLLYKLHIPSLTMRDFSSVVAKSGLLTEKEELSVFRYISGLKDEDILFPTGDRLPHFKICQNNSDINIISEVQWQLLGFTGLPTSVSKVQVNGQQMRCILKEKGLYFHSETPLIIESCYKKINFVVKGSILSLNMYPNYDVMGIGYPYSMAYPVAYPGGYPGAVSLPEEELAEEEVWSLKMHDAFGLSGLVIRRRIRVQR